MYKKLFLPAILLTIFTFLQIPNIFAQYSKNSDEALVISGEKSLNNIGEVRTVSGIDGITYIAWQQLEKNGDKEIATVRLQLLDKDGNRNSSWNNGGILVANKATNEILSNNDINLAITAAGEAIVSVIDNRNDDNSKSVTLYKIKPTKEFAWGMDGITIHSDKQNSATSCANIAVNSSDEIIYSLPTSNSLLVNIIKTDGTKKLANDIQLSGVNIANLVTVDADKFYLVYLLQQNSKGLYVDLYNSDGSSDWKATYVGNETGNGFSNQDIYLKSAADGENGVIIAWKKAKLYVQRISESGERLFSDDGITVSENAVDVAAPLLAVDVAAKSVNVAWLNSDNINYSVQVQKIDFDGNKLWKNNGISLVETQSSTVENMPVAMASTGDNCALLVISKLNNVEQTYEFVSALISDLFGEGINKFGELKPVYTRKANKFSTVSTNFFNNQIVIAWCDRELSDDAQPPIKIKTQNISYNGILGPGAGLQSVEVTNSDVLLNIFPNPAENSFTVSYFSENFDEARINIYNLVGKLCYSDDFKLKNGNNETKIEYKLDKGFYKVELITNSGRILDNLIVK